MTFKNLRFLIHSDMERYAQEINTSLSFGKKISFFFLPCVFSLILFRISYYFFNKRFYLIARFFYTINLICFGIDLAPSSNIGSHLYIPHPVGIVIVGNAGKHCTFFAQSCIGGGVEEIDIGAGMGLPVLGDHVTVSAGAKVLGPYHIGSHSIIGALTLAITNIPEYSTVVGIPGKVMKSNKPPLN